MLPNATSRSDVPDGAFTFGACSLGSEELQFGQGELHQHALLSVLGTFGAVAFHLDKFPIFSDPKILLGKNVRMHDQLAFRYSTMDIVSRGDNDGQNARNTPLVLTVATDID